MSARGVGDRVAPGVVAASARRAPDVALGDVEGGVDRLDELVAVLLRYAEQRADDLHRQLGRDPLDEVDRPARLDVVDE